MGFVGQILSCRSVSIVGMSKNAGKTECLNYILSHLGQAAGTTAVTSVGVDGEERDQIYGTAKPDIRLEAGTFFATSEKHYREKELAAEIFGVLPCFSPLGRTVLARAVTPGRVILSGPSDTSSLRKLLESADAHGIELTLIDGALSRLSPASPAVTEAMVLVAGAAAAGSVRELVAKTKYLHELTGLEKTGNDISLRLRENHGVLVIGPHGEVHDPKIGSALALESRMAEIFALGKRIYVPGAVTDSFLRRLTASGQARGSELIVRDFTRIFASAESYYSYLKKGGVVKVLLKTKLLAVCVNPHSPTGRDLDPDKLLDGMRVALGIPVYDIRRMDK